MTEENINLFLRIYDRCLRYGDTHPKYKNIYDQKTIKYIFEQNLRSDNLHMSMYVFSAEQNCWSREVLLYFVYRLNLSDRNTFTNLLFSVYNMTDANTSLFTFFSHDTIIDMFQKVNTPFCSKDEFNDFDDLDNDLTVYRGIRSAPGNINRCGFSWTLKRKIAKDFSFQDNPTNTAFIVSGQVNKKDIFGYLTNRGEAEIVIAANLVKNKVLKKIEKSTEQGINYIETIITN
ncbi:hypothetical protein [Flavobacterium panacagri]|uniref:hypothetical protein n=1 Tax=Flavobacterium panacagri TaxID=3034146 RepID=UPI0025A65821|nr:hypothetical protein [Flavobacterium panacagri]